MVDGSLINNGGKNLMLHRTYTSNPTQTSPSQFKVGVLNETPAITDTDLDNPIPISGTTQLNSCDATTGWSGGTDIVVALNTTAGQFKEGTGCLNFTKTGTTVTSATLSNTSLTGFDDSTFNGNYLHFWFYITDTSILVTSGTAVEIRYGIDTTTNYYYKQLTKTEFETLQSGSWADIRFDNTNVQGTVSGTLDSFQIIITTPLTSTVWGASDVRVDDLRVAEPGDYFKTFVSGYPTFDTTNREVGLRCFLNSGEANGYNINGLGIFNTDSTPILVGEDTVIANSKSDTDEFTFIVKDRIL